MKRIVLAAILATTAAAGYAGAQQVRAEMSHPYMSPLRDMARDEAKAKAVELFARLDVNHDGKLDPADRAAQIARWFDAIDTDHNGQISRAEFMAMHDHGPGWDGEPGPGHEGMRPDGPPPPPGGGPGRNGPGDGGPGGPHHGMHGPGDMMALVRMADANHDGAISQAEFMTFAMRRFDMADTNHDGKLSPAEQETERRAERARMHEPPGGPPPPPPSPPAN